MINNDLAMGLSFLIDKMLISFIILIQSKRN